MLLGRWVWVWIGLVAADIVLWLIADSQVDQLLTLNATGTLLTVLQVLWVLSLLGLFLLVAFGAIALARSQVRGSTRTRET